MNALPAPLTALPVPERRSVRSILKFLRAFLNCFKFFAVLNFLLDRTDAFIDGRPVSTKVENVAWVNRTAIGPVLGRIASRDRVDLSVR